MSFRVRVRRLASSIADLVAGIGHPNANVRRRALRAELATLNAFYEREGLAFRISEERLPESLLRWERYVDETFDARDPDRFYASWTGEIGALNLAVNVQDQLRRSGLVAALQGIDWRGLRVLDVGAGSAAIHAFTRAAREVVLLDVENLATRYNRFKFAGDPRYRVTGPGTLAGGESFDVVICIDVLEHLREPSRFFAESIEPFVARRGRLLLQSPWGAGVKEHLPEAPRDWKSEGGAAHLARAFRRVRVLNPIVAAYAPSGLYARRAP